jgi:hypothetical protein
MNEQEKFDDLLRSKSEERDFPFDETNWDKAEELIERSEKKRRFGLIGAIFMAGIVVGIVLMLPFINNNKTPNTINNVSSGQNNSAAEQNKNAQQTSNNAISAVSAPEQHATDNKQVNSAASSQTTTSQNNTSAGTEKKTRHTKNDGSNAETEYSYVRPSVRKKDHRQVKAVYNPNSNKWVQNKAYKGSIDVADSNQQLAEGKSNVSDIAITEKNTTDKNTTNVQPKTIENNSAITNNLTQKSDTTANKKVTPIIDSTAQKRDSSTNTTQPIAQQPPTKSKKYSHTLFSADAGGGYSLGWKKENGTQGNGLSPILGISVAHYFSSKISALIGLQYNSLGNINTLYSNSTITYDFGTNTNINSVTVKTLYYISLPIKLQYNISNKNMISGGIDVLYLLNTSSSVVSYNQNYFGVSGNTALTKMGYMDGINNMDAQLTLAYRRKTNRFTVTAEGYYGLLDIESNTFFGNNVFERNSGLRFILSYDIIK